MHQQATYPFDYLLNESHSLLARLGQVKPFSMTMPMVRAASVSDKALKEITTLLEKGKTELRQNIHRFIRMTQAAKAAIKQAPTDLDDFQSGFTILKLRFNSILEDLDIFAAVLSQRAEYDVGIWTSALDVLAKDGLQVIEPLATAPQLIVYLDRGHGAAIRRARTRLPGGDLNPVGVIQIPRERMIGSGIASSLIHEVGHQAAALLNLVPSLKLMLKEHRRNAPNPVAWQCFERWISEIIADVWSIGHLGTTATLGLMGVVTLPDYFQFRLDLRDPHPAPFVRVLLSCAFGRRLFPHPQWDRLETLWRTFYPGKGLSKRVTHTLEAIEEEIPTFVEMVVGHSTKEMKGKKLLTLLPVKERQPARLQELFRAWRQKQQSLYELPPSLVFAIMGQAKSDLQITAAHENDILTRVMRYWAFSRN
jgi:hypothetical protein